MKKELLSPAGDFKSLKAAVNNGADAVYLAGKNYGARKFAKNFNDEELTEAIKYAHLYGVKVYVTVNTIIYEEEIEEVLKYICFLDNIGVDALIVQDLGLIKLIRKYFPYLDIHASTQAHTHNIEQIRLLEKLGVKRVVLAREMSLEEINALDTNMELEVFVHGALCICYSGQCLFSAFWLNRSGNRGECAGLCRVLYNLKDDQKYIFKDKYLLSPKELNTTSYGEELKRSKIGSFKIEGRMKSPEYVGYVTRIYRKILDNDNYKLSSEEIYNLQSLFNRGFTKGYLFNNSDKEFMSLNSSNHQGVEIGEVIKVTKKRIKIKVGHDFSQGDALRFPNKEGMYVNFLYDNHDNLIKDAKAEMIVEVQNKVNLQELGKVYLTVNKKLEEELNATPEKKIGLKLEVYAYQNADLKVTYFDGLNEVEYKGDIITKAKTMPLKKERVKEIFSKLGDTPFKVLDAQISMGDDIFMPVGVLNQIKRDLIKELIQKRTKVNKCVKFTGINNKEYKRVIGKIKISALARNKEQVETLIKNKIDYIYVTDQNLYQLYKKYGNVYLRLDRVIEKHLDFNKEKLLIGESGSLKYASINEVISDYYFNVVNSATINLLDSFNVKRVTLSPEANINRMAMILKNINDIEIEIIGYGRIEYMIMKYDLITNMNLKDKGSYELENKKAHFKILRDKYTHIMSDRVIDLINNIKELQNMGVNVFRIELLDEKPEEIEKIIANIKKALN